MKKNIIICICCFVSFPVQPQKATGKLNVINATKGEIISSFDVISGSGGNGVLPNGKYTALGPTGSHQFYDGENTGWKMEVNQTGWSKQEFKKGSFVYSSCCNAPA